MQVIFTITLSVRGNDESSYHLPRTL